MSETKPKWTQADALTRADTASRVAAKYASVLDAVLSPNARTRLLGARAALGDERAIRAVEGQKTATAAKDGAAKSLQDLLMDVRNAVTRTTGATDEQKAAVGIGTNLSESDVNGLLAQVANIESHSAMLASAGVSQRVLDALGARAVSLRGAAGAQAARMGARAETTEARLEAHLAIESLVDEISSRGVLEFQLVGSPRVREQFERLVSSSGPTAEDVTELSATPPVAPPVTPA